MNSDPGTEHTFRDSALGGTGGNSRRGSWPGVFPADLMKHGTPSDEPEIVKDNYFHWEFNMCMKLARKGLLPQIIKPEFDQVSDRSTDQWKTNDLKALGVIAGDVSLTYQVYIRGAMAAMDAWTQLQKQLTGTR